MDEDYHRPPDDPMERAFAVVLGMALPYLVESWVAEREEGR